jgi:hypothetical protein
MNNNTTKLRWYEEYDDNDNTIWCAASMLNDDGSPFEWRLKPKLFSNQLFWYEDHDAELINKHQGWSCIETAKAEIQKREDAIPDSLGDQK